MRKFFITAVVVSALCTSSSQANDKNPFAEFSSDTSAPVSQSNLYPMHPRGAVGLFHTYSAQTQPGSAHSFGMGFIGNYYLLKNDFPTQDLITERFDGGFYVNYTPWIT
ncbi:MAG: hypothetical protein R3A45_04315 [Bdellovibrionota bacterium]